MVPRLTPAPLLALASTLALAPLFGPAAHAAPSRVDLIEHLFGASNVNAVVGNGRLTVGLSTHGDASVLSWPSPSYCDQLLHIGRNDLEVREDPTRTMAAADTMGAFVAVRVTTAAGTRVHLPRSDRDGAGGLVWTATQAFPDPRAAHLVTTFTSRTESFDLVVDDVVDKDRDVWVRRVEVVPHGGAAITDVEVLGYWNLSPTVSRIPQLPLADWAMDAFNDYAGLWSAADQALVHYRPAGRGDLTQLTDLVVRPPIDFGPVGEALATGPIDASRAATLVTALEAEPAGVYAVITSPDPIVGHQVGFDDTPTCALLDDLADNVRALPDVFEGLTLPLDPGLVDVLRCDLTAAGLAAENGWSTLPRSAFSDLADGVLEGASGAAGQVDSALAVQASAVDGRFRATLALGFGATLAAARTASKTLSSDNIAALALSLPAETRLPAREPLKTVAARALVNLLLAQDANTGAIVASVARQAPYGLDWPRDGAFFTAALDVAGLAPRASKRVPWLLSTQRTLPVAAEPLINGAPPPDPDDPTATTYPAGAWEMNYYADGLVGGNIRWEIDNTALVVWSLCDHARYLTEGDGASESPRAAHEAAIFPHVRAATDLLARWRDPATGLQAPASEDDNAAYTQTLHGAITTWAALDAAAKLAAARPDLDTTQRGAVWSARADGLRQAILTHLVDDSTHRFREGLDEAQNPGNAAGGPSAWALWPARFLRADVPAEAELRNATEAWLLDLAEARLDPANGGSAYVAKLLVAVALSTTDPARKARAEALLERLATTTSSPDTRVFGEVFAGIDTNADGTADAFSPRVANPHVWAGTLVYLSAMALEAPERFTDPLASPPSVETEGGGCTLTRETLWSLLALALIAGGRRAMRTTR
jgi:hypothetical protein